MYLGKKVLLTNGKEYDVEKVKRTNFVGVALNGDRYDIPLAMIDKIVGDSTSLNIESYDPKQLKKGQLFWINKGGNAITFIFDSLKNSKILGINPINKGIVRIDNSFQIGIFE